MPADTPAGSATAAADADDADDAELQIAIAPTPEAVRDAHVRIVDWMDRIALDAELRGNIEIVMGEALNNVVEHAFADCANIPAQPAAIRVRLRRGAAGITVCICDRGREMPGLALPKGKLPEISDDMALLPEGGFGWFLIRELSSRLEYGRENGWNRLDLVIAPAPATAQ